MMTSTFTTFFAVMAVVVPAAVAFQAPTLLPHQTSLRAVSQLNANVFKTARPRQLLAHRLSCDAKGGERSVKAASFPLAPLRAPTTAVKASSAAGDKAPMNKLLLGGYFLGWYVLNVGYNIYVKKTLNVCPLPFTFAVIQLGAGIIWLAPQWLSGMRAVPKPSEENKKALAKVALLHGLGQLATVTAMGLGSVSFVNVVKALEPLCTALIGFAVTGINLPLPVWLSMVPVCAGVGLASVSELNFTWACFACAMFSNVVYASRGVLSKLSMDMTDPGENMDAANTYAVVTMMAFLITLPIALILEGSRVPAGLAAVKAAGWSMTKLAQMVGITGLLYYTYNEMAFLVLGMVAPITQSVGNTIKRVVVIVSASIAFRTPMTPMGIAGSSIAILGVLLYSVVKGMYPDKPKAIEEDKKE